MKPVGEVEILRQEQFKTFVKERLSKEKIKNMHDPFKQQISTLKSDCALFSRLRRFFEHENHCCPPSISQNGKLRLPGKKFDLTDCIQSLLQPRTSAPTPIDVAIIDGAAQAKTNKYNKTISRVCRSGVQSINQGPAAACAKA